MNRWGPTAAIPCKLKPHLADLIQNSFTDISLMYCHLEAAFKLQVAGRWSRHITTFHYFTRRGMLSQRIP